MPIKLAELQTVGAETDKILRQLIGWNDFFQRLNGKVIDNEVEISKDQLCYVRRIPGRNIGLCARDNIR